MEENTEKYITFSVPISKELDSGKNFLSEKLHGDKFKDCKSELDYMSIKNNQLVF